MITKVGHIRKRVFEIINVEEDNSSRVSKVFDFIIVALIFLNVLAVILSSFSEFHQRYSSVLDLFELLSIFIFSFEYCLRIWTAPLKYPHLKPGLAILRYIVSFAALIDLAAILPFYFPSVFPVDLRFLRILRVTRILRVFNLQRYSKSLNLIKTVIKRRSRELLITVVVMFLLLWVSASLMYQIEKDVQAKQFPNIIASLWWAVVTLTTIGYGDVFPVTIAGKILAGFIAFIGIGLVALPAGIVSSGFLEEIHNRKEKAELIFQVCPHCGKKFRRKK